MSTQEPIAPMSIDQVKSVRPSAQKIPHQDRLTESTTNKIHNLQRLPDSLNEYFTLTTAYNGRYDTKANDFTNDAKRRYIRADEAYFAKTAKNMVIHSGRRTVQRQAELYIDHTWHNRGNSAAWPGCSYHNWGLAADMVRSDEENVLASMNSGGWHRTYEAGSWHFQCTSSPDHAKAATKIASFRIPGSGLSYRWSEQIAHFYTKTRDYNERKPILDGRLEKYHVAEQTLDADIQKHNQEVDALVRRVDKFNEEVEFHNSELDRAQRLADEINAMPDGPERQRKISEFKQLDDWLVNNVRRLSGERDKLEREDNQLVKNLEVLHQRHKSLEKEANWIAEEQEALSQLNAEKTEHENNANSLLSQIEQVVQNLSATLQQNEAESTEQST